LQKNNIVDYVKENHCQMLGSSGTVTTLAAIQCGLERYDRQYVDQSFILTQNLRKICRDLSEMSEDERTKHPCVGKGRSELILAGASILEGIFDTIPLPEIRIADRGIREGILSEILVNMNRRDFFFSPNPPLSNIE
jgi:exopolyphosphatase/guanosine-5'-triphosphate,3'-diphosphate pyrophosphatase